MKISSRLWRVVLRRVKRSMKVRRVRRVRKLSHQSVVASRVEFAEHKVRAGELVAERVEFFNITNPSAYGFKVGNITIRNQRSRWGSCSLRGNLSFNYRVALLPERLLDYVVVHELCHLGEFNHSPAFWKLLAQTIPDYEECRAELKKIRL